MNTTIEEQAKKLAQRALAREKQIKEAIKEQMEVPNKTVSTIQNMKYFKQGCASGSHDWTAYGAYEDSDITPEGDIRAMVYSVDCDEGKYYYECYENYFSPDEITETSYKEYLHVMKQLQKVDKLQAQIDEVLKAFI